MPRESRKIFDALDELMREARAIRGKIEPVFGPDTAQGGVSSFIPSSGHCAAVAAIAFSELGGELVSAIEDNQSHWFNRISVGQHCYDVDLTGDQFGRSPVQIGAEGTLYRNTRVRSPSELNDETLSRAITLALKAGFSDLDLHLHRTKSTDVGST